MGGRRATSVVLPALVVLGLVTVVAIAAGGSTSGGDASTRPPSDALFDAIFTIGLVGVVLGGVLFLYGLTQRKAIAREMASGRYRRTSVLAFVVVFALFTALTYWRLSEWKAPSQDGDADPELAFPGEQLPTLPPEAEASYEPGISWLSIAVVAGLLLAAVASYVAAERRSRRTRGAREGLTEDLAAVLDDTLDDLRGERDPRRAIIAAYARLERVLAAHGVPRRPAETPDEYVPRVLGDLELEPAAIGRLTALFTRAKFSQHDLDTAMKEEAIDALEAIRDDLRAAREVPASPRSAPLAGTSA